MVQVAPKISVIILNYNGAENVKKLVSQLNNLGMSELQIVVLDNASTDSSYRILNDYRQAEDYVLIQTGRNGGYAFGNNIGLRYAEKSGSKYALIMNGDITLHDNFIVQLEYYLDAHDNCAICSPVLESTAGDRNYGKVIHLGKLRYQEKIFPENPELPFEVEAIVGACFLVRLAAMKKVGYIPEEYFLNFEETEWCLRFRQAGYSIVCLPYTYVSHSVHGSINAVSGIQDYFLKRNLILFNRRMTSRLRFALFFIKSLLHALLHAIKHHEIPVLMPLFDGLTGHNKYI